MAGRDLARLVTPDTVTRHGEDGDGPRIAVIDTGIKASMVRELVARGARVSLHPARAAPRSCSPRTPTRSSSPTARATRRRSATSSTRCASSSGKKPVWGICLGHQLLCRAVGLETFKLPFGHRGANHPVKDLTTGRVEITSQNHGFAVVGPGGRARSTPTSRCAGRPTSAPPRSRT